MTTVHLVYPHGPSISCPDAIGRHLAASLSERYTVKLYDWDSHQIIRPGPDDVLLGHPHPWPRTVFRRSARFRGWKRVITIIPFNHAHLGHLAFAERAVEASDLVLAITGGFWFDSIHTSPAHHWAPKMRHLDLAVDRTEFPRIKVSFNPPGQRRFLYIGHSRWTKNTGYLSAVADLLPEGKLSWIGAGTPVRGLPSLGYLDFAKPGSQEIVGRHDFTINVSKADANPATILESMSWGLIPVCTKESGYSNHPGIVNLPLNDPDQVADILRRLDAAPEDRLLEMRAANDRELDEHFNWNRFSTTVINAIEDTVSPLLGGRSPTEILRWNLAEIASPYSFIRPRNAAKWLLTSRKKAR